MEHVIGAPDKVKRETLACSIELCLYEKYFSTATTTLNFGS